MKGEEKKLLLNRGKLEKRPLVDRRKKGSTLRRAGWRKA